MPELSLRWADSHGESTCLTLLETIVASRRTSDGLGVPCYRTLGWYRRWNSFHAADIPAAAVNAELADEVRMPFAVVFGDGEIW